MREKKSKCRKSSSGKHKFKHGGEMKIRVSITGKVEANELVWYLFDPIIVFTEYRIYKDKKIIIKEKGIWYDVNKIEAEIKSKLEKVIND